MDIVLKPVQKTNEDGELIMKWRNDMITREMSYNSELKEWITFEHIFKNTYFSNYIQPVFAYYNNEKIAFIGFIGNSKFDKETNKNICKIGINIAPQYRGKRLGAIIINKCIKYITEFYPLTKKIIAEIKPENINSKKLFEKCNFKFIKTKIWNELNILVYQYDINLNK